MELPHPRQNPKPLKPNTAQPDTPPTLQGTGEKKDKGSSRDVGKSRDEFFQHLAREAKKRGLSFSRVRRLVGNRRWGESTKIFSLGRRLCSAHILRRRRQTNNNLGASYTSLGLTRSALEEIEVVVIAQKVTGKSYDNIFFVPSAVFLSVFPAHQETHRFYVPLWRQWRPRAQMIDWHAYKDRWDVFQNPPHVQDTSASG